MGTLAQRRAIPDRNPQPVVQVDSKGKEQLTQLQPTTFKPFSVTVASVGTPQTLWTPATGLRWRVMGWEISTPSASKAVFKEASVAAAVGTRYVTATLPNAGTPLTSPYLYNGFTAASRNNQLVLDSDTAGVSYSGTVFGIEEPGD